MRRLYNLTKEETKMIGFIKSATNVLSTAELRDLQGELNAHSGCPAFFDDLEEALEEMELEVLAADDGLTLGLRHDGELFVIGEEGALVWSLSGTTLPAA